MAVDYWSEKCIYILGALAFVLPLYYIPDINSWYQKD